MTPQPTPSPEKLIDTLAKLQATLQENNKLLKREAVQGTTNRPYYRETPARDLQQIIDNLVRTRKTQCLKCPEEMLFDTFRNKISQAKKYLLDQLDSDKYYLTLFNHIDMEHKERTRSTFIRFRTTPMLSESVPDFAAELEDFIRHAVYEQIFERTGLDLTSGQLHHFNQVAADLDEKVWATVVDKTRIIFAKIAP